MAVMAAAIPYTRFDKAEAEDAWNDRLRDSFPLQVKNTFIDVANNQEDEEINSVGVLDAFRKRQMSEPVPQLGVFGLGVRNRYAPSFDSHAAEEELGNEPFAFSRKSTAGLLGSMNSDLVSELPHSEATLSPSPCHVWPASGGGAGDISSGLEEMPPSNVREGAEPMRVQTSQSNLATVAAVAAALSQQQQHVAPDVPWTSAAINGKAAFPGMEELAEALQGMGLATGAEGTAIPPAEWANTTTVMMRHIPNKYTQRMLLTEINHTGFLGTFDFLYLPIDPETNANRGYAFLNFIDSGFAWMFRMSYEGRKMNRFNSNKVVSIMPATLQGFEANYSHYASARVNRGDPSARPLFLREPKGGVLGKNGPAAGGGGRRSGRRRGGVNTNVDQLTTVQPAQSAMFSGLGQHGYGVDPMEFYFGYETEAAKNVVEGAMAGQTMVPKFCPHCGSSIQPTFQFCPSCGEVLNLGAGAA